MGARQLEFVPESLKYVDDIIDDFDGSIEYQGSDPHDFHVHAASIAANAEILLTCDKGLLNQPNADEFSYEAFHPDDFFVLINDSAPLSVRDATMLQLRHQVQKHGERNSRVVDSLIGANCPQFAEAVRLHLIDLAGAMPRNDSWKLRRSERLKLDVTAR